MKDDDLPISHGVQEGNRTWNNWSTDVITRSVLSAVSAQILNMQNCKKSVIRLITLNSYDIKLDWTVLIGI